MDNELKKRIEHLRYVLGSTDDPAAAGDLAPPSDRPSFPQEVPKSYQAFLRVADGAVCGVIDLYESAEVLGRQAAAKPLPGGRKRWFCIGEVEEQALVMEVSENTVHLVDPETASIPGESLGELDYFLLTSVFGEGYAEFVFDPEEDLWYQLLQKLKVN